MTIDEMWETIDDIEYPEEIKLHLMMIRDKYEETGDLSKTEELTELITSSNSCWNYAVEITEGKLFEKLKSSIFDLYDNWSGIKRIYLCSKKSFVKYGHGTTKGKFKRQVANVWYWTIHARVSILEELL